MSNNLVIFDNPEIEQLSASKAEQIRATFMPMAEMLAGFEADFADIVSRATMGVTPELSAEARRLRLDIAKVRVAAEKARVEAKAEYLLAGKAIDGANNILKHAIAGQEAALEEIEKHAERIEAERVLPLLTERAEVLTLLGAMVPAGLGTMEAPVWEAYREAKVKEMADRLEAERVAAEKAAEAERRRVVEAGRTKAMSPVYHFLPEGLRDDPASVTDAEFDAAIIEATTAMQAAAAAQEATRLQHEKLAREAAAERQRVAALEQAERNRVAEAARAEAAKQAETDRLAKLAAKEAKKAATAPVKARLSAWIDSFALPELPGEPHPAADVIRVDFEQLKARALLVVERIGAGGE